MKVYYQCETCGKKFATEEEAKKCEEMHETERANKERLKKEKLKRAEQIEEILQAYVDDYKEFPSIKIKGKIMRNYRDWISDFFFGL